MHDQKLVAIVLHYKEQDITAKAIQCLYASGYEGPFVYAKRDGVGRMSRAFNIAYQEAIDRYNPEYVWFITNVTFGGNTMIELLGGLEVDPKCAAIQPSMPTSDHEFLRSRNHGTVEKVPFVEWTAPMIRTKALYDVGLLYESMGYVHFDMEWCWRAMGAGYHVCVDFSCAIDHQYLYRNHTSNFWTRTRKEMRLRTLNESAQALALHMDFEFVDIQQTERKAHEMCKEALKTIQS